MKKRSLLLLMLVLVLVCSICLIGYSDQEPKEKILVLGETNPAGDINPVVGLNIAAQFVTINVYDTLIGRGITEKDGEQIENPIEFEPMLAESFNISDDGLNYIFNLRRNVKFHNGSNFDAEDVLFSFDLLQKTGSYAAYFDELIENVEKVDQYTVNIKLSRVEPTFFRRISTYNACIMDKETVISEGTENLETQMQWLASNAIGTGCFILKSLSLDMVTLVANKNYWKEPAKLDKVIIKTVAENSNLRIMLERGDIDIYRFPAAKDLKDLEDDSNIDLMIMPANSKVLYFGLNVNHKPFDNINLRKAIACAIPYDQIINVVEGGEKYTPKAKSLLTSELFGFEPTFEYKYDIEKAREYLIEAGYKDGINIQFDLFNVPKFKDSAVMLQTELARIGIKLDIVPMAPPAFFAAGDAGNLNFFIVTWWDNAADPVGLLSDLVYSKSIPSPGNWAQISVPEIDRLIEDAKTQMDNQKRKEDLVEIQKKVAGMYAYMPVSESQIILARQNSVKGYVHFSDSIFRFYTMDKEK